MVSDSLSQLHIFQIFPFSLYFVFQLYLINYLFICLFLSHRSS